MRTTYLEAGRPVTVLARWRPPSKTDPAPACPPWLHWHGPSGTAPRNVAIRRADGSAAVRPFRGLRKPT
ncbi:hypothetical protein Acsp03_27400 [Actinomadura sp. NBRC 104412]|uniref:hypothetical protein n=1 Tax=Actinomadura sp. NBRC 104412 TaxID=3032203 RepID=UPI00249F9AF3|nr:hypothetical protein [Actinomadura sp. NBRC 104412]GLZ05274.1 hypothetical protein Acsp03_27400 [Actinomadura sp. NBRC 104412]